MIGLDLRPCPGMHASIPRRARHRILIPHWTAITQGETIGLPTAIQTLSAPTPAYRQFSGRSCQTACYNSLTLIRPQHRGGSYLYRSCQFMVSNRCPGCNNSDTGSSGMSAGRVCRSTTGKRCALSRTVLSKSMLFSYLLCIVDELSFKELSNPLADLQSQNTVLQNTELARFLLSTFAEYSR